MIAAKTLLFIASLSKSKVSVQVFTFNGPTLFLVDVYVFASGQQQLVPNATLYIPRFEKLGPGEMILASEVTVQGASTIFQLVDNMPSSVNADHATSTLSLSPTGAYLFGSLPGSGASNTDAFVIQCSIDAGLSACELSVGANDTVTRSSSFTQTPSGIPVVALNFQALTTPSVNSGLPPSSSQDSGPMETSSSQSPIHLSSGAANLRASIVPTWIIILVVLKLI